MALGVEVLPNQVRPIEPPTLGLRARFLQPHEMAMIESDWRSLAAEAAEPNPYFSPFMAAPALLHLCDEEKVSLACVWESEKLIGILPVTEKRGYAHMPIRYLETWIHPHCFYGAPLVRCGAEDLFFRTLYRLLDQASTGFAFIRLRLLDVDGPMARAAARVGNENGRLIYDSDRYDRALLKTDLSHETYLLKTISKRKRNELQRQRNRLMEIGDLTTHAPKTAAQVSEWAELFLQIEHAGWKGAVDGSMLSRPAEATFFRDAISGAYAANALNFYRLDVGEKPIAMQINFLQGGVGHGFKICFDEGFSKYSPGVLMLITATMDLLSTEQFISMDSCSSEDHPMINGLWTERRGISAINVSAAGVQAKAMLSLCRILEGARENFQTKIGGSPAMGKVR